MTMLERQCSAWTHGRHWVTRSLLLLLCAHGLVVLLFRTRSCATKQRTGGVVRDLSLETLQVLFRELDLSLEVVDPIDFGSNVGYWVGQDFDVGRFVKTLVHRSGKKPAQTKVVAHAFHEGDDDLYVTLQSANGLIDMPEFLAVALDNVVIERDLLFEAGNGGNHISLLIAWRLGMLVVRCNHGGDSRVLVKEASPYTRAPLYFYPNPRGWPGNR